MGIFIVHFNRVSGAMMPGPLLGVTIEGSLKGLYSRTLGSIRSRDFGVPLVFAMAFEIQGLSNPIIAGLIGFLGGGFLAWMGYDMIKSSLKRLFPWRIRRGGMGHGILSWRV